MHAAVGVNEIVFVVVAKERSEAEAFDVEVRLASKARAAGAERGRHAVAAVTIRIECDDLRGMNFFAGRECAQREFREQLFGKRGRELVGAWHVEAELARELEVTPDDRAGNALGGKLGKRRFAEGRKCFRL